VRVARLSLLAAAAGLSLVAVWRGTTPMVVIAGLLLFVAGLDSVEPLAQEVDHPDLGDSIPVPTGDLQLRQIAASVAVMVGVCLFGGLVALLVAHDPAHVLPLAALMAVPTGATAAGAAAMSVVKGPPPLPGDDKIFLPPEATGMRLVVRLIWPPLLVILSVLPSLAGHDAFIHGRPWVSATAAAELGVLTVAAIILGWLRFREQIHATLREATGGAFGE
jgi:hypothetical protein